MSPRRYDAPGRRAAAAGTRERILEAARAIVGGKGDLDAFSMETVARRAGVARMTVYYQFRSRAGLLEALADHLAARGGLRAMREVFLEANPEAAFRRLVATFVRFWASDRVTLRRLRAMAVVFPSQDRGPRDRDAWRREAVSHLYRRIAPRGTGPAGLSEAEAIDLLTSLTSFETYDALAVGHRDPERVVQLLDAMARGAWGGARPPTGPDRAPRRRRRAPPSGDPGEPVGGVAGPPLE